MHARQDDLGRAYLQAHPLGEQWRQLDVTVAVLTFEQIQRLAHQWRADPPVAAARGRAIAALGPMRSRMASRWIRWASTFGLPSPPPSDGDLAILTGPYQLPTEPHLGSYARGLLPVYDAALAIMAGRGITEEDYEVLAGPWRRVCLPSRFTPVNLFGEGTQPALASLAAATGLPRSALRKILRGRRDIDDPTWREAIDAVDAAVTDQGYPYRARCLYWETVPYAETAAGQSPTDVGLAEALFGFAAAIAFAAILSPETIDLLKAPYRAGGRVPPPV